MAKDDYYVVVYKILAYLYTQLKAGERPDPKLLSFDSSLLGINEFYWTYIMRNMLDQGYIEGIEIIRAWGQEDIVRGLENCMITPGGIGYLMDNDLISKAKQWLKDAKEMIPFI